MSSDYKNMMDDDIADTFETVKDIVNSQYEGHTIESIATKICRVLSNPKAGVYEDIIDILNTGESPKEMANKIIEKHYLSPGAKRRLKMKNEELRAKITEKNMRGKFVKENLNESDLDWFEGDNEGMGLQPNAASSDNSSAFPDITSQLEEVFQSAADEGLTFEEMQNLCAQALDEIDWVEESKEM